MKSKAARLFLFLTALVVLFSAFSAGAGATELEDKRGSLKIVEISVSGEEAIPGLEVSIYKVASIINAERFYEKEYEFSSLFGDLYEMMSVEDTEQVAHACQKIVQEKAVLPDGVGMTDEKGEILFEELEIGLYLITIGKGTSYGVTELPKPFIVQIPVASEDGTHYVYDVTASPKTDSESRFTDISVKKAWKDFDNKDKKRPEAVTIELYADGVLYDTVALTEKNGWKHTWEDLSKLTKWTVKEINTPSGYVSSVTQKDFDFEVVNTYKDKLPQTGQNNMIIIVLAALGVVLVAGGAVLIFNGRKEK